MILFSLVCFLINRVVTFSIVIIHFSAFYCRKFSVLLSSKFSESLYFSVFLLIRVVQETFSPVYVTKNLIHQKVTSLRKEAFDTVRSLVEIGNKSRVVGGAETETLSIEKPRHIHSLSPKMKFEHIFCLLLLLYKRRNNRFSSLCPIFL